MFHSPIQIQNLGLTFVKTTCFKNFSTIIYPTQNIAIVGRNGSGKTTLLKILQGKFEPSEGNIFIPDDVAFGYVPQITNVSNQVSGAEEFNKSLSYSLTTNLNVLILDEPTNHLDLNNRKSLIKMFKSFKGTIIIASHDMDIIDNCFDIIWHIQDENITVFSGSYTDYLQELSSRRASIEKELSLLNRSKEETHLALMKEQKRAKNSKIRGEKSIAERKWPTMVSCSKARQAIETAGRKKSKIFQRKEELSGKLSQLKIPEIIIPKFSLPASVSTGKNILNISNGACGYAQYHLDEIYLTLASGDRISISGDNGCGKTTFIKAILNDPRVSKNGEWQVPDFHSIGYLDQHYNNLDLSLTVFEAVATLVPNWNYQEIRHHLNDFLFRKNEQVNSSVATLSGGEKARLSLAKISAKTPKLLILDEITNNLDYETKTHVSQILRSYPGTLIVVSHDAKFLNSIDLTDDYAIVNRKLQRNSTENV